MIRRVVLRTTNALRLAEFYHEVLGLMPREDSLNPPGIALHHPVTGDGLLSLIEERNARPSPSWAPGLFHIAFLFARMEDWRVAVRRAIALPGSFQGASDHGVSWAAYFSDPEGNGLEFAWDKDPGEWPWHGDQISMVTRPLPLRSILLPDTGEPEKLGPFGIGHLHLQVADLKDADAYRTNLGLRVTQADYPGARFLARGRYHHHLAINTWRTNPRASRPENATGLVGWDMTGDAANSSWRDPSGSIVTLLPA